MTETSFPPSRRPTKEYQLLDKFVAAVLGAPRSLALTATRDAKEFWERHVLDTLKALAQLPEDLRKKTMKALDVGSGNGVPGIPIAVAMPEWHVDLLDSNTKKCGFLDMFCKLNEVKNVTVLPGRAEELAHTGLREQYDLVWARALGKLPTALELASPFAKIGGAVIVPHGTSWQQEATRAKKATAELHLSLREAISYYLGTAGFRLLVFDKWMETPEKYPRTTGVPAKRPL